jgi:hypothetical protein
LRENIEKKLGQDAANYFSNAAKYSAEDVFFQKLGILK